MEEFLAAAPVIWRRELLDRGAEAVQLIVVELRSMTLVAERVGGSRADDQELEVGLGVLVCGHTEPGVLVGDDQTEVVGFSPRPSCRGWASGHVARDHRTVWPRPCCADVD